MAGVWLRPPSRVKSLRSKAPAGKGYLAGCRRQAGILAGRHMADFDRPPATLGSVAIRLYYFISYHMILLNVEAAFQVLDIYVYTYMFIGKKSLQGAFVADWLASAAYASARACHTWQPVFHRQGFRSYFLHIHYRAVIYIC